MKVSTPVSRFRSLFLFVFLLPFSVLAESSDLGLPEKISYHQHVRPIFQAKCHGCHQPAKAKADYVMTDFEKLISGGEGGEPVIIPFEPENSYLIELVTLQKGDDRPEMPEKDEPLTPYELAIVTEWVEKGARDDTPENARQRYSQENPPQYAVPPVITSLDYSPDGRYLAMAGFHEVLLHEADGSGQVARFVGLSERIESVRFSPDGKYLAVAGGLPGRMGEVQVWDVEKRELKFSKPVGFDTAYGASWSPNGNYIAYGMPDNTVRAIKASNGDQVLFMGGHNDWVLDTAWSVEGDHLVSVGRDMSAKLTHVETERFIDNITSITPGALKGGMNAVVRHPTQDHILVGGSDGVPQIYRMFRETDRKIGDNANLIRKFPPMQGRIWSVAFAPDGKQVAAVSSLNGHGQINIFASDYDATITPKLKKLFETARRNPDGSENINPEIEAFHTAGADLLHTVEVDSPIFSVAYSPDGKTVAAGSGNGRIRLVDTETGSVKKVFVPVEVSDADSLALSTLKKTDAPENLKKGQHSRVDLSLVDESRIASLSISPASVSLDAPNTYNQLLVTGRLDTGESVDLTRHVNWSISRDVAVVEDRGVIRPVKRGKGTLTASFAGKRSNASVVVSGLDDLFHPDFIVDVNPILTRLGCNAGTCHGAKDGKEGFKLSLRGYDRLYDVRAFSDDHAARRVNYASPDDSLMLLKATAAVPHEGGMLTDIGSDYYQTVRQWIIDGTKLDSDSDKVSRIEMYPKNPVIDTVGSSQQIRVVAYYPDGSTRDVTREAFIETGNMEVAYHDDFGLITTIRRGEAPILARYEGAYAATTVTVMGDRTGFVWEEPESWNEIDKHVSEKWERMKIRPSRLTTDTEFIRRIYLDLTGLPPTPQTVVAFVEDAAPTRIKREKVIDDLIGSPEFVDHWSNKWADMLQVNSKFLGREGAQIFRDWIREQVAENRPYDEFVRTILSSTGSNKDNPAASYYKILRTPEELVENTTHLFLATRFNCNKCHDHPFEKWNVDNYYQTAAFFSQIGLERDKAHAPQENIGGSAVENSVPLYEIISDIEEGEVTNIVTGEIAKPTFPYPASIDLDGKSGLDNEEYSRREKLAAWITAPDNQFFAKSYANRIWGYLTGTGIIEPIDDIRAGNPPTNPQLLDYLTQGFVDSGFDVRALIRVICNSRTYQLSIETNTFNEDDEINYSHAKARRLPAEVLFDAVYAVTGSIPNIPGAKPGMRAAQLADAKLDTKSGFLANLGRPTRESACECDRQNDVQLGAVMSLLSGPSIAEAVGDPHNQIARMVPQEPEDSTLIEKLYLRVLSRLPTQEEIDLVQENWSLIEGDHQALLAQLAEMESDWVWRKAELETQRYRELGNAKAALEVYRPEYEREKLAAEQAQKKRVNELEQALARYVSDELPQREEAAIHAVSIDRFWTRWTPQVPEKVEAKGKLDIKVNEDASILATGDFGNSVDYIVHLPLKNTTVSGVMLEALTDDILPGFGPGYREQGNFVVTEFMASYRTASDPDKEVKLRLVEVAADYTQQNFDVNKTINGVQDRSDKAWSVGGQTRRPHWARFKLKEPLQFDEVGGTLTISVICRYSAGDYPLAKFRLFTTDAEDPLNLGLPIAIAEVLKKTPTLRTDAEQTMISEWYQFQDPDYLEKRFEWVKAGRALPEDMEMVSLQAAVAELENPVPEDPTLVQLRRDVQYSVQQTADRRLTAAQDLAWALINNSAFIFNH